MERKVNEYFHKWKKDLMRKPLLVYGPKQVGKTYSTISFGKSSYVNFVYFNTDNNKEIIEIFKEKNIEKIIMKLSHISKETILKNDTLIILDNVNDLELVKSVKLFSIEKSEYHIIMITSRRENLHRFKGEELQYKAMYGMDFEEYLWSVDKRQLADFIKESYTTGKAMPFHTLAIDYFYNYLETGSLPEVIEASNDNKDSYNLEAIKVKVIDTYKKELALNDTLIDITRSIEVLDIMPYQLKKENKKFQYGMIGFGRRAKEYETAIEKIVDLQIAYRSYKIKNVKPPLSSCREKDSFKLYANDVGILYTMMHGNKKNLFIDEKFKYTLYENYVAKHLTENNHSLYYYQSDGKAEVSFVLQNRMGQMIPIEIVSSSSTKSKSLTMFIKRYTVKESIRLTEDNFAIKRGIRYLPIYALFCLKDL